MLCDITLMVPCAGMASSVSQNLFKHPYSYSFPPNMVIDACPYVQFEVNLTALDKLVSSKFAALFPLIIIDIAKMLVKGVAILILSSLCRLRKLFA